MNIEKWLNKNTTNLLGKTVAITGSTGGLGNHICQYLAKLGANIILCDRNQTKSLALKESLLEKYQNATIENVKLDLSDFESVKSACETLKTKPIDILIHNAGAYKIPRYKTEIGYDNVFQINFISPYYITKTLMPTLRKSSAPQVVIVGSIAHNYSRIDTKDIDFSTRKPASKVYGNAKRFLMFSMFELFKNETKIKFSITHPGITFTNITAHYPKFIFAIIKYPMKVIFMKPKKAALSIIKGLFVPCEYHTWIGPRVFNIWGLPKKQKLKTCKPHESEMIFKIAEEIYSKLK